MEYRINEFDTFFTAFKKYENPMSSNTKNNFRCKIKHQNVCRCNYKFDTFLQKTLRYLKNRPRLDDRKKPPMDLNMKNYIYIYYLIRIRIGGLKDEKLK